jgi:hypothetical protein
MVTFYVQSTGNGIIVHASLGIVWLDTRTAYQGQLHPNLFQARKVMDIALNQIPAQAEQRGITQEEVVRDVMMGKSRIKEMMSPIEVANLFISGFSRFSRYLIGGDLLFDGGMVLTY